MEPQDELARRIQAYVSTQVPPDQVAVVTRAACMAVATVMREPQFLSQLQVIRELHDRIAWLHNENILLKQMAAGAPRKAAPKKAAAPRKAAAKRPSVKVSGGTKAQRAAFRQGYSS